MKLRDWFVVFSVVVLLGCLKVSQRNGLIMQGYSVGENIQRLQVQERELAWLKMDVLGASSPTRLAKIAQEREWDFVAWSTLQEQPQGKRFLIRLASAD